MDRRGLKIYFLVFGKEIGNYENKVQQLGCEVLHIEVPKVPYIQYKRNLKSVWKTYGPFDVVHTHTLLNNGINCKIFNELGCRKIISHSHSTNSNRKNGVITKIYESLMKKWIKRYATDYIACGVEAGEYLYGKELFSKKGMVIPNGVDVNKFSFNPAIRNDMREVLGIEDEYVIGHVARLSEVKNHKFVLEIMKELKKCKGKYKYVIIGDGPCEKEIIDKISELELEKDVMLLGNRDDINDLQNAFDLVVYPSFYEGVPVALIEAQMNGIPCIVSSNVSQEVKIMEYTKFISLEKSSGEWADEIIKYQCVQRKENHALPNMKAYDIKASAEKLREIYLG